MAQHDMNIANQGFPATRADLNNALQALVSNSSGTSAPSTTFANQWWYDTTNNKMYLRNEANNAWIEVATLDQTNNEWKITTGVVQAKDSDGLALKTDDGTTRLFIKDSDGNVGIGTSSPSYGRLHITDGNSDIAMDANGSGQLHIDGNGYGFGVALNASGAQIYTNTASRDLIFGVNETERMRITDGKVGIGTTSPQGVLSIVDPTTSSGMEFHPEISTDTNRLTNFDRGDSTYKNFVLDALNHEFRISGTNKFVILTDGRLKFGSGNQTSIATAEASIHSSETRYYKLINYSTGYMLDAHIQIHVNRNGGFNQTAGYIAYNAAVGGYSNSLYGPITATGDSGESSNAVIHTGTDECIYLRTNPSTFGGTANCVIIGRVRNWAYDGTYVTSAP